MLTVVSADVAGAVLFKWFARASAALAVLSVVFIHDRSFAWLSLAANGFFLAVHSIETCRRLPGAIMLAFLNLVYLQFPLFYIGLTRSSYDIAGAAMVPHDSEWYLGQFVPAMMFFGGCYLLMTLGMLIGNGRGSSVMRPLKLTVSRSSLVCLVVIGLFVLWTMVGDMQSIFSARADQTEKTESLVALLFNDKMYQLLFPVLFYLLPIDINVRRYKWCFAGTTALFIALNLFSTSKGAILVVGTSFFVFPAAIYYRQGIRIYWPRTFVLVIAVALAVPLYFYGQVDRAFKSTGQVFTLDAVVQAIRSNADDAGGALAPIAERVSTNVNNFVMIYGEYRHYDDDAYRVRVRRYVWLSFLNLVLPGTPYPEAYVLSSQLLFDVVAHAPLESLLDKQSFLTSANTQPYTLFGFFMVAAGPMLALLAAFGCGLAYSWQFNIFRSAMNRALLVFSATIFYACYGFDASGQFVVLMVVTVYFSLALLDVWGRLTRGRSARPAA